MSNEMINNTQIRAVKPSKLSGTSRYAALLAAGALLAGLIAGCGGGGGSSSSGPTAPGIPITPTSGDFNDLVVKLVALPGGGYTVTQLAAYSDAAPYTSFGTYVPGANTVRTQIWMDSGGNGQTATTGPSPIAFYIDDTADTTVHANSSYGVWYTQTSLNSDGAQHVLVLQRGTGTYYLAFEDLSLPHNDTGESEPTLKQILAGDGATYGGNTVEVSTQTF